MQGNEASLGFERRELLEALQDVSVSMLRAATAAMSLRIPSAPTCLADVAGGCLAYSGNDVPLTRAIGVGTAGKVSERDLDQVENFFRSKKSSIHIVISERTDPEVQPMLTRRGYKTSNFMENWWLSLRQVATGISSAQVEVTPVNPNEADAWVRTVAAGFAEGDKCVDEAKLCARTLDTFYCLGFARGAQPFLARVNGQIAGGGVLHVADQKAHLRTTSCRLKYRRLGVQTALLAARLKVARELGCKIAFSSTDHRGTSARNLSRVGFTPLSVSFQMSAPN